MSSKPVLFRLMKRLEDTSLISPWSVGSYSETHIDSNGTSYIVPFGFAYKKIEAASKIFKGLFYDPSAKLEIWTIECENFIPVARELHPYQLMHTDVCYKTDISKCYFNNKLSEMPVKIGMVKAPEEAVFCKNIILIEMVDKNYG